MTRNLPGYEVNLAISEGPFEDDDGDSMHLDLKSLQLRKEVKQLAALTVDVHSAAVKLARNASLHMPDLIVDHGQGGLVAAAFSRPTVLERALQTRNVQRAECSQIAQARGGVKLVFIAEPRVSKTGLLQDKLKVCVPELYAEQTLVDQLRVVLLKNPLYGTSCVRSQRRCSSFLFAASVISP